MYTYKNVQDDTKKASNKRKAIFLQRFFKTGKGEYAYGDAFYGLTVPQSRLIAKKYCDLEIHEIAELIKSQIHEERLIALLILVERFGKENAVGKKEIYSFYLSNTRFINNWDLVDLSAARIVGTFLLDKNIKDLIDLSCSNSLWDRRIAIISTFAFIYEKRSKETFEIATRLLGDSHDLIHKAVGWMLREVGKRCGQSVEEEYLKIHYKTMPRTMLRYAIEHFKEPLRKAYLKGNV